MRNLTTKSGRQNFQVRLQREGHFEKCGCLRMEARGAIFRMPGRMDLMAALSIRLEFFTTECNCRTLIVEGIVINCVEYPEGCFEITVLFLQEDDFDFEESSAQNDAAKAKHLLN